jgi:hypothetical protein
MDPDEELHDAARRGDLAAAHHAVDAGANAHTKSPIGLCALHFAAQNGHDLLCEFLLEETRDAGPRDKYGRTPIHMAAVRGHEATVQLLCRHGAELSADLQEKMEAAVFKRKHRVRHIESLHAGDVESARAAQRRRERIQRQRERKKQVEQDLSAATARVDELEEERDEKPVVDWWSEPRREVAEVSRLYARPTFLMAPDEETAGAATKRVPFDRADAALDDAGWPTAQTKRGETPSAYPCLCVSTPCTGKAMDVDEMGTIGGTGLRLYFFLLSFLYTAFFVMAVLTTPSVILNKEDTMYNHPEAARYSSGMAETTLGNVAMDTTTLQSDKMFGHKLWTISTLEACGSLIMLAMVLRASGQMNKIVEKVDRSGCTMGDYTVMVQPAGEWSFYAGVGKKKQQQLIEDVEETLERTIKDSQIAEIGGEPCIWIAWDDDENIELWTQKRAALQQLEGALNDAYKGDAEPTLKILERLDAINNHIRALNDSKAWTPVYVFATFQQSDHYEEAIARSEPVEIGDMQCKLLPAPEPETLVWEHLEVTAKSRKRRKWIIIALTILALAVGAAIILSANKLKAGVRYIDYCADVMGPDRIYDDVCPLPTEPEGVIAADRDGRSERTVNNYREKFVAVSEAAGGEFPRIDTAEIQANLALPICGTAVEGTCENDPRDFLRFSGLTCSELIAQSTASDSAEPYQVMPTGVLSCPLGLEIATEDQCQAAFDYVEENVDGFDGTRGMQEVNSAEIPLGCSVQQPQGANIAGTSDASPHWNSFAGETTGTRGTTGEFRLLCKHWDSVAGCEEYFIPNILQVKELCPLSCDVPATECDGDTSRYMTGDGFVRTDDCHYMDMGVASGPTEFLMAGGDVDAMCYACLCTLASVAEERAEIESFYTVGSSGAEDDIVMTFRNRLSAADDGYCDPMAQKKADASKWAQIATVIVVVINQVLKRGIKASAPFTKAHTIEVEMVSTALRVYACQSLNTAILMLILGSNFWVFGSLPGEHYDTVNAKWYATVGTPLIQTMIIQFATPCSMHLIMHAVGGCKRSCAKGAKTQNLLNAALAPTNFEIAAAYGEILLAATVTLLFGAGIPLLYHVAAVGFFVRYNIERWVIVRVAKRPPLYSKQLFESFDEVFAILLLVHAAMAVYFMSSAGGARPSDYIFLKAPWDSMHGHVWPMMISFICVALGFIYKFGKCKCVVERRERKEAQKKLAQLERRRAEKRAGKQRTADTEAPEEDDSDSSSSDEEEYNPPFTEAYDKGLLINEDDDYTMDQFENLVELETAFIEALENQREKQQEPFDDEGFYRRCKHAVQPVLDDDWVAGPNDGGTDGATRYVEAQKEKKRLQKEKERLEVEEAAAAAAEEAANKETKDVEKAYRALLRARESGDEDAVKAAEDNLHREKEEAAAAAAAANEAEKAEKAAQRERAKKEKARLKARKDSDKQLRLQKAIKEEAEAAAAEARAAKEQEDLEQAELELERAELGGDAEAVKLAEEKVEKEKEEAVAAAAKLAEERAEALKALQDNVTAAEEALAQSDAELAKRTEEAQAADARKADEQAKVEDIYEAIVAAEKTGDLDAIEAQEARLATEKEIAEEAKAASPRARDEQGDAQTAHDDAEAELSAAREAVELYEAQLVTMATAEAKVKEDRENEKLRRKVRTVRVCTPRQLRCHVYECIERA